jgi:hypothetical protein
MSIPSQHVLSCSKLSQVVLCVSTVVYMCLEWPWENGVFFRDSAGIRRVLYRTLFGCCSDVPRECSGAPRRIPKKVRTKSVVIPAQDRIDIGSRCMETCPFSQVFDPLSIPFSKIDICDLRESVLFHSYLR